MGVTYGSGYSQCDTHTDSLYCGSAVFRSGYCPFRTEGLTKISEKSIKNLHRIVNGKIKLSLVFIETIKTLEYYKIKGKNKSNNISDHIREGIMNNDNYFFEFKTPELIYSSP